MSRILLGIALAVSLVVLAGCSPSPTQPTEKPAAPAEDPTSSLRLANGLHELEDGKVIAIGILERSDLEGGFWLIATEETAPSGTPKTAAVIANGSDFEQELKALEGKQVSAEGKKLDGASIRMAGPEIEISSIEEITDTPGIAE